MMKIHKEGIGLIVSEAVIFSAIIVSVFCLMKFNWLSVLVSFIFISLFLMSVNFFRYPTRVCPEEDNGRIVIAPADGKIVVIEEIFEPEFLKENCLQVSIFMSVTNVHANWIPISGTIEHVSHHDGRFQAAYLPKSSVENERSAVIIRTKDNHRILVRQVAGAIARRIVTYSEVGDKCKINDPLGFIKFGSRVDLYLPLETEIAVEMDQLTQGNITRIGKLPNA